MNTLSGGVAGNHLEQRNRHAPIGEDLDLAARRALRRRLLAEQVADGTNGAPQSRNPAGWRGLRYLLRKLTFTVPGTNFGTGAEPSRRPICSSVLADASLEPVALAGVGCLVCCCIVGSCAESEANALILQCTRFAAFSGHAFEGHDDLFETLLHLLHERSGGLGIPEPSGKLVAAAVIEAHAVDL